MTLHLVKTFFALLCILALGVSGMYLTQNCFTSNTTKVLGFNENARKTKAECSWKDFKSQTVTAFLSDALERIK